MLTYGGIPLLLPDEDGDYGRWMRLNQDIADIVQFGNPPLAEASTRRGLLGWYGYRKGIGQTVANWPAPPVPRLNALYWPTGASRWARGWFLATERHKNAIVQQAHSVGGNTALALRWGDPEHKAVLEADMYLLPPRVVSRMPAAKGFDQDEALWLLPLVDARYWWQFTDTADLEITSSTTWANVFTSMGTAIGSTVSVPTATVAAYLSPDPYELTRRYENAALMLDAAALSVGKRIVRRLDGTVRAESASDAAAVFDANVEQPYQICAGAATVDPGGCIPEKVIVTFRKWRHYALLQKGQVYTEEVTPGEDVTTSGVMSGVKKVVHSTMHADYSSDSSPPANTSDLTALAEAIAGDYYAWLNKCYDLTFAGEQPWELCGYDDHVLWNFGRNLDDGRRLGCTRVQSLPADFGFEMQMSQKSTLTLFEPMMLGKADSNISKGSSGTVSVWTGRAGSKSDSTINVTARATGGAITAAKFVALTWIEDDWEVGCWEI